MATLESLPLEIQKRILCNLDKAADVLKMCTLSRTMYQAAFPVSKQIVESKLGVDVVSKVFPDVLAVVMFPVVDMSAIPEAQKAIMEEHLMKWKNGDLIGVATENDQNNASRYLYMVVVPFTEDYGRMALDLDLSSYPVHGEALGHKRLPRTSSIFYNPRSKVPIFSAEEHIRLIRAFSRFDLFSKVIKARSGPQLWTMTEQEQLLATFFDAWEVEEILCVQQYVMDAHVMLWREHMISVSRKLSVASAVRPSVGTRSARPSSTNPHVETFEWFKLCFDEGEHTQTSDHVKNLYRLRQMPDGPKPGPLIQEIQFLDIETQSTFVKQLATLGLGALREFLAPGRMNYDFWVRRFSPIMLHNICTPEEAEYFGISSCMLWTDRAYGLEDLSGSNASGDGNGGDVESVASEDSEIDRAAVDLGRNPCLYENKANTAWKALKFSASHAREGYRRCGWVFWDDDRLKRRRFWASDEVKVDKVTAIDLDAAENRWITERLIPGTVELFDKQDLYEEFGLAVTSMAARKEVYFLMQVSKELVAAFGDDEWDRYVHPLSRADGSNMLPRSWDLLINGEAGGDFSLPAALLPSVIWG
ncbi:uncharacterized protein CTRU02_209120 [Colletotrichum truncatum]|uniref:Uncharacterized protein n=1 Tax=Colletotrichum truncatum TaxID=5467 RepID=A0ACC3YY86_COLTU|nr:uncharacterized protein CTRU02_07689 [Colletotrichum truncatum]KAF6790783.1 hypothetical protein CTRU02_07689 [Colletotrichum truncatum]